MDYVACVCVKPTGHDLAVYRAYNSPFFTKLVHLISSVTTFCKLKHFGPDLFDYLTLYRRLNHGKRLVFFDYLGVFKTTKGPGAIQVFRCSGNNLGVGSLEEVTVTVRISVSSKPCFMNLNPFMVAN